MIRGLRIWLLLSCLLMLGSVSTTYAEVKHSAAQNVHTVLPQQAVQALKENNTFFNNSEITEQTTGWKQDIAYTLFLVMALCGVIPVIVFFIEHNLAGLHAFHNHFKKCKEYTPNVAVIIPSWNEDSVLEHTIDILLQIDYPMHALKLYIVDDGSTDGTPELVLRKQEQFPDNIVYLRKDTGGKGKAHAINHGLDAAMANPWTEALLLIDADISFKQDALKHLTRHLADPEVGAVTGYIKVGNRNTNYITRSIGYEYIVSQSIARRAQNVLGVVACLAGGVQLHTRQNIEALGGHINTSTLAEDTYTTLATQKMGKQVVFEGNSFVYAEEPKTILDVWKQRFRWARGNLQITNAFKGVWFRKQQPRLGNYLFGIIWFCVILTPLIMILSAVGFVGLFFLDKYHSAHVFFYLASISFFVYLYTTIFALLVDRRTSRLSWSEGIIYPGLISLFILLCSVNPDFFFGILYYSFHIPRTETIENALLLFMETWSALCMLFAYLIFRLEYAGVSTQITNFLLVIVGYGPLLCVINLSAYIAEMKRPSIKWDKTEKISIKRIIYPHPHPSPPREHNFEKELHKDILREYRFFCRQILSLVAVTSLFILLSKL